MVKKHFSKKKVEFGVFDLRVGWSLGKRRPKTSTYGLQ